MIVPSSPIPFVASLTVASFTALEVPKLPPLSRDTDVIMVVDVLRVIMLIAGLSLAALIARQTMIAPERFGPLAVAGGFRWRSAALVVGLIYVCLYGYERLTEPVTVQFLVALVFVSLTAMSAHRAASLPLPDIEGEKQLLAHLQARDGGGGGSPA